MLIDENKKETKSPKQILDDLSKIKLDSQKEKEKNLNELKESINKIEAEKEAKENAPIENIIIPAVTSTTKLTLNKSGISPVVEQEPEVASEYPAMFVSKTENSNDSVSFKDITDRAKSLEDIVNNVKPVEVPHIDKPKDYKDTTHTSNNTDKDISVITFNKSDNNYNHDIYHASIDDYIKDIPDIKNDCKAFKSDIKELFSISDKLHVTDSRIKNTLNRLKSNLDSIMTILFINIIVTIILAVITVYLIISNINIKSEIKYIEENTIRSISSAASYYNEEYDTNDTSNSSSSITMQNDDTQDKYSNEVTANTNDSSEDSSSVSNTGSSTDIKDKDAKDESTSSLEDSEDATGNTNDTDAVALIENEYMYYDILNTTTENVVGTFENRVLTNNTSGDVSYSLDIVSSDGTVYELKSGLINTDNTTNNYDSVKKEARQYDIISSIDDALIDSDYLCEITLSKCECSDNKVRYMITTYKGYRNSN